MSTIFRSNKLYLFEIIFVLIDDGKLHDDDIIFAKILNSRRTSLVFLSTKTDNVLDAESRECHLEICDKLKERFLEKGLNRLLKFLCSISCPSNHLELSFNPCKKEISGREIFAKQIQQECQSLEDVEMLYINAPTIKCIVNGNTDYLHYKIDEIRLLDIIGLKPGCHYGLENLLQKQKQVIYNN